MIARLADGRVVEFPPEEILDSLEEDEVPACAEDDGYRRYTWMRSDARRTAINGG